MNMTRAQLEALLSRNPQLSVEERDPPSGTYCAYINIEELYKEYLRTGSVHEAGDKFGISGETARKRLTRAGKSLLRGKWNPQQDAALRHAYSSGTPPNLDALSLQIGKSFAAIACRANELSLCYPKGKHPRKQSEPKPPKVYLTHEQRSAILKQRHAAHPHPLLGTHLSQERKQEISVMFRKMWADPNHKFNSAVHRQALSDRVKGRLVRNGYSRSRAGKREDLGMYFRSAWEANYARYLNWLIKAGQVLSWDYEKETFWFDSIKRGSRSYTCDFRVTLPNAKIEYHEIKGWLDRASKTKLKRMKRFFPAINVILIGQREYQAISRTMRHIIPQWESRNNGVSLELNL